jgi:hypothetical protein
LIACQAVFFRQLLYDDTACASYLFGGGRPLVEQG